jgi:hypothetical protein
MYAVGAVAGAPLAATGVLVGAPVAAAGQTVAAATTSCYWTHRWINGIRHRARVCSTVTP